MNVAYQISAARPRLSRLRAAVRWPWRIPIGVQSLFAAGIGALVGAVAPSVGVHLGWLSTLFIALLQMMVLPLVFPVVAATVARVPSIRTVGRLAAGSLTFFLLVTTAALLIAAFLAALCHVGAGAVGNVPSVARPRLGAVLPGLGAHGLPTSVFAAFAQGNIIVVTVFALVLGAALSAIGAAAEPATAVLESFAEAMVVIVGYVIRAAPLGVFGIVGYDVAHYGFTKLSSLAGLIAVIFAGMAIVTGILFPFIAAIFGVDYCRMLRVIGGSVGLAFVTRSSQTVLGPLLTGLEQFGIGRVAASFVVPLGYSFNTVGSVVYQAVALVFLANAYGIGASVSTVLVIVGLLAVLSKGMTGVASASFVILIGAAKAIGLPPDAVAVVLGVDFIADMPSAAVNVIGNALAAAVIDASMPKRPAAQLPVAA